VVHNTQTSEATVDFLIDTKSGIPIYRQIIEQIRFAIAGGSLEAGQQLPTVRRLAADLAINPNTVIRAYRELEIEGVLETQQGSGTFISPKKPEIDQPEKYRMLHQIITEMMARASSYGFSSNEIMNALQKSQEASS